ncbi:MAG: hypothetical protein IH856_22260 [Deltaproteobacteria bacterium]|nr:hypothetical protein [Deltaproteobacteria bacterium]
MLWVRFEVTIGVVVQGAVECLSNANELVVVVLPHGRGGALQLLEELVMGVRHDK